MKAVMVVARQRARRRMKVTAARLKRVADADVVVEKRWNGRASVPVVVWCKWGGGRSEGDAKKDRRMQ